MSAGSGEKPGRPEDERRDRPSATPEWKGEHPAEEHAASRYEPSEEEVTRLRAQGLGVGAQDLALQQDPIGSPTDRALRDRINRETNEDEVTPVPPERTDKRQ